MKEGNLLATYRNSPIITGNDHVEYGLLVMEHELATSEVEEAVKLDLVPHPQEGCHAIRAAECGCIHFTWAEVVELDDVWKARSAVHWQRWAVAAVVEIAFAHAVAVRGVVVHGLMVNGVVVRDVTVHDVAVHGGIFRSAVVHDDVV